MDTSDPDITFDGNGVCNHCHAYDEAVQKCAVSGEAGRLKVQEIVAAIRNEGRGKRYDCVIGVSGGVDSTYVAYVVKNLGLRPLAVHLDNGWNSELAVKNIENVLQKLNIDLHTHVIDWEEFRSLQVAFLRASTPDSEIPSDHAIVSLLYKMASKLNIPTIITGYNSRTESHLPRSWSYGHFDWKYIRSVNMAYGKRTLRTFPHMNIVKYLILRTRHRMINILDYLDYSKQDAMKLLENELNWKYYGGKHYESIYTRFYQGYILPGKFGFDKRRCHLSSLICSGEVSRHMALRELEQMTYPLEMQQEDRNYVIKKLGLTDKVFEELMSAPRKTFGDYPSYEAFQRSRVYALARSLYRLVYKPTQRGSS